MSEMAVWSAPPVSPFSRSHVPSAMASSVETVLGAGMAERADYVFESARLVFFEGPLNTL
jgi:hypothetical protein